MKENKLLTSLRLFRRAFGSYRHKIILLVFTGFLSGFMEGIGINTIIPLFSFVVKGQEKPTDIISITIEKVFNFLHIPYSLSFLLILIAFLFTMKAIMVFASNYITERIRTDYVCNARNKLLSMTLGANWSYLSKQKIGHLEKIVVNEINAYSTILSYVSSSIILLTNACIYIFIAFNISPQITLITLCLGGIFFVCFKPVMDKVRILSHHAANAYKQVANHINESMIGIKTIKAMALEDEVTKKGWNIFDTLRKTEMKQAIFANLTYVITQPFSVLVILVMFAYFYKFTNTFSFASFAVIIYSINKIFIYVQDGQARLQNISSLYPYLKSVSEFEMSVLQNREPYRGTDDISFTKKIEFKNVSFSYSDKDVLKDINLIIPKGQMVGVIGPSGSGKTTLVDLVLSLMRPQQGDILIDDKPLADLSAQKWKQHIGYVSQDIFIVNDTLANNIKFYDSSITDEDMIEAAKQAHIYDFIMGLPHKFHTPAGERGMELSGGQRQRIALARVLARKADILVLDEATSALDNESEAMIQNAIEELRGKITMIIIAHRPSTITKVDQLVIIKAGKITEVGSPQELLKKEDSYFHKISHA